MVAIDRQEVIRQLERVLGREIRLRRFIRWYFAEHHRVASFQANQRISGEATLEQQVAASRSRPGAQVLGELWLDLEEYRTEAERKRGEVGLNDEQLRERLRDRLRTLKDCVQDVARKP